MADNSVAVLAHNIAAYVTAAVPGTSSYFESVADAAARAIAAARADADLASALAQWLEPTPVDKD